MNVTKPKEAIKMNDQTDGTRRGRCWLLSILQGIWEQLTSRELVLQRIRARSIYGDCFWLKKQNQGLSLRLPMIWFPVLLETTSSACKNNSLKWTYEGESPQITDNLLWSLSQHYFLSSPIISRGWTYWQRQLLSEAMQPYPFCPSAAPKCIH